jgi:hypothetical protein
MGIPPESHPLSNIPAPPPVFGAADSSAYDPIANGVAAGTDTIDYVIGADPFSPACEQVPLDQNAPYGTCANETYDGSFSLAVGSHTVYFMADDFAGDLRVNLRQIGGGSLV